MFEPREIIHLKLKIDDQAIDYVLSRSLLLESLEITLCWFRRQVIASQSLRRLVIHFSRRDECSQIACPNLEELVLGGSLNNIYVKFMNLPSSVSATLSFHANLHKSTRERLENLRDIMKHLRHVKEL